MESQKSEVVRVPELGEAGAEGVVAAIAVEPGQIVSMGQTILEVETDKVVVEVPSEIDGIIEKILVNVGDRISMGSEFARIKHRVLDSLTSRSEKQLPQAEVNTDEERKSILLPSAPQTRTPTNTRNSDEHAHRRSSGEPPTDLATSLPGRRFAAAGPAARRLARELGVTIADVPGSGPRGRISKSDVKNYAKRAISGQNSNQRTSASFRDLPGEDVLGPFRRVPLSNLQRASSRNMVHAVSRVPHAWLQERIDITDLEAGRQQLKQSVAAEGGALTLTALLCKSIGHILKQFTVFNAVFDDQRNELLIRDTVNIGVAVDTARGLVVPVLRNAHEASLSAICVQLSDMSKKARNGRLGAADMRGASLTISNLGGIGTSGVFPLVNWPEVAILGVGKGRWEPTYRGAAADQPLHPRLIVPVTIGFDHRVINGADGAKFLNALKSLLESPFRLFSDRSVID